MRLDVHVHHHHHHDRETKDMLMAISAQIQTLLAKVQEQRNVVQALVDADKVRDQLIADLRAKIEALPTGQELSDDDKAALLQATSEIEEANATLTQVTTENTALDGATPPASDPNGPQTDPAA